MVEYVIKKPEFNQLVTFKSVYIVWLFKYLRVGADSR